MRIARFLVLLVCTYFVALLTAGASHLVTGNGFGFAVALPETGTVTRFYAHPYSFVRPDGKNPLSEGVETANFIKEIRWSGTAQGASAEYEEDSQVIHIHRSDGDGIVFMPFGLRQTALIISWQPGSAEASQGGFQVEWSRPVRSERVVRMLGAEMHLLKLDGIEESLLLIPLEHDAS